MKVEQLMTRDVVACRAHDRLNRAAQIMWECDCGCVPVVDEHDLVIGIVTDRDVCMAAYTTDAPLSALAVGDVMCRRPVVCGPFDTVAEAERLMQCHRIRRLPVVGFENQLLGLLSLNDLARAARLGRDGRERGVDADAIEATLAAIGEPRAPHAVAG